MSLQCCLSCDGRGSTRSEEWEGDAYRIIAVACEGCCGCGELRDCLECGTPVPANEAPYCGDCAVRLDSEAQEAEMARIRRVA